MKSNEYSQRITDIRGKLFSVAYVYCKNDADAQDALGESIYRGLKSLRKLKDERFFETWMVRIVINQCKTLLARKNKLVPMPEYECEIATHEDFDKFELLDAVERLPEQLKSVVTLRYFSGYTLKQTAEILQIPQGTAVTRQRRALALLQLEMEEDYYDEE